MLARYESAPAIEFLGHSTTIATNALLGQRGLELPRVALVTTHGFRDVIEIGRQNRSAVYDLFVKRPTPLVARADRFTVVERIDYRGEVLTPLDSASLARACEGLRAGDFSAVAVCLLNSYANDAHEKLVAQAVAAALPHAAITRSSEIANEYREYERFSTAVVNAALAPVVQSYLERLQAASERALSGCAGGPPRVYVMRSDAGMSAADRAASRPAALIESGPAAGVLAAAALGERIGARALLSFDMGGTTAKAGAIVDGAVQVCAEFEAAGATHSGRAIRGSGYPVRFPFVDLAEVSAGGGTIAWIDDAGALQVGPISAGADPGPACYGKSGVPTVTDANVVLGRLDQTHLLGGTFAIDASRSRAAVAALGSRLGLGVEETAAGIVRLIDAAMSKVLQIVTVERGLDPRDFTLIAFGGGGPLHACSLAAELGIARVLVPAHPGIFSAYGLLVADVRASYVHPLMCDALALDRKAAEHVFASYESQARETLLAQGADAGTIATKREYDARYRGQGFELTIPHHDSPQEVIAHFAAAHRTRYGYDAPNESVELVNARLTATASLSSMGRSRSTAGSASVTLSVSKRSDDNKRRNFIDGTFTDIPVHQRESLAPGTTLEGPAIVEQYDTTTYVAPGWLLTVEPEMLVLGSGAALPQAQGDNAMHGDERNG